MSDTANLSFRYLQSDYIRALRSHYSSQLRVRFDIFAAIVAALLGAYLWRFPDYHWLSALEQIEADRTLPETLARMDGCTENARSFVAIQRCSPSGPVHPSLITCP